MLRHITALATQELMVQMTRYDGQSEGCDVRTKSVCDPCVGSGRMLLHSSNFSVNLYGQDIDPLAVAMCKINGALYAPWISFPLPPSILGMRPQAPRAAGEIFFRTDDCRQRLLFEP